MRISNSFSEGEIQVMDFIVQTLLRGGSPSMAVRNKDFASLCRKIQTMKSRVNEKQIAEDLPAKVDALPAPAISETIRPAEAIRPAEPMQQAV
jgi:methionyl-tRNA formyltransferase